MELVSYAMDYVSFLMHEIKEKDKIKSILLFGSVARGEANKNSDIDLFVDVFSEEKSLEKKIIKSKEDFFNSVKFKNYWKLFNVKNEINVIIGKLENWKLKDSMLGSSIVLYEKFSPKLENGKNKTILSWEVIKDNSKRVMLNKKLVGFVHKGKRYKGLLEIYQGVKLGANVIMIPVEELNLFLKEFRKFKVKVKIIRVFEYSN